MSRIFGTLGALMLAATIPVVADAEPAYPTQTTATVAAGNSNPQVRWRQQSQARPGEQPSYSPYPPPPLPPSPWYDPYPSYSYRNE